MISTPERTLAKPPSTSSGARRARPPGRIRFRRLAVLILVLALASFAVVTIRPFREPVLRAAGWALVVNEPVEPADIIVVTVDSGPAGALEAADLVQSGIAKRVAVFRDPPDGEEGEFIRRGISYEDAGARQISRLRLLGVTDMVEIPRVDGTEGEGQGFNHGARSISFDPLWLSPLRARPEITESGFYAWPMRDSQSS